jgi:hypothetical protein
VHEHALALLPGLDAKTYVVALGAVDAAGLELSLEQDVPGIEIGDAPLPGIIALRKEHARAVVEVKAQTLRTFLGGHLARCGIGALDGFGRRASYRRGRCTLCGGRRVWRGLRG